MEKFAGREKIILLMDRYSSESRKLHESLRQAGYDCLGVVLEDDGFLPKGVISVYDYFLGKANEREDIKDGPKYFNEVKVPASLEISGGPREGRIHDLQEEKGKIIYAEPLHQRLVKQVDWYDRKGVVRLSEHYNRYGRIYASTVYNAKGQRISKSWLSAAGREVILENFITKDILVNCLGKVRLFQTKLEFTLYFFEETGYGECRVFFNSLSIPFFVSNRLKAGEKRDVLFWQEPIENEIPGNMQMILRGEASRASEIVVQGQRAFERLCANDMVFPGKVHKLGFIYPYKKENRHRYEALICTNSDCLEQCDKIIKAFPQMTFHIAALTKMSLKLINMEMQIYDNVKVYQLARREVIEDLFEICDYYFDINYGTEIVSSVYQAFLYNHLIFAFRETAHNTAYVPEEHVYAAKDVECMIQNVRAVMSDNVKMEEYLCRQRKAGLSASIDEYRGLLG